MFKLAHSSLTPLQFTAACFFLAEGFLRIFNIEEGLKRETKVNFCAGRVKTKEDFLGHVCETSACHGGWAAVLLHPRKKLVNLCYQEGADSMAKFLGFEDRYKLSNWAFHNPEYWGNESGAAMFNSMGELAFGKKFGQVTLLDISEHWAKVGERVLEAHKKTL